MAWDAPGTFCAVYEEKALGESSAHSPFLSQMVMKDAWAQQKGNSSSEGGYKEGIVYYEVLPGNVTITAAYCQQVTRHRRVILFAFLKY